MSMVQYRIKTALNHFIIHLPQTHANTIKVGDKTLYLDSSYNPDDYRILFAEVVATPAKVSTPVKVGDYIYFHPNVIKNKSMKVGDDLYLVDAREGQALCYAYKSENTFRSLYDYIWVAPEQQVEKEEKGGLVFINKKEPLGVRFGMVRFASDDARKHLGQNIEGKRINFRRFRNMSFDIDGEKLFRMRSCDVNIVYGDNEQVDN